MEKLRNYLATLSARWTKGAVSRARSGAHFDVRDADIANDLYRREERELSPRI